MRKVSKQILALSYVSCLQCRALHKNKRGFMLGQMALYQCFSPHQEIPDTSFDLSCVLISRFCLCVVLCVLLSGTLAFQLLSCCCSCETKINDYSACSAEKLPLFNCCYCAAGHVIFEKAVWFLSLHLFDL